VQSSDEDSENSDLEEVLPTIRKVATIKTKDLTCLGDDWRPWDTNVPYKYTKVVKGRKERHAEGKASPEGKRDGNITRKAEYGNMDEATLRKYISKSKKERGVLQILKNKRKRLYGGKEECKR